MADIRVVFPEKGAPYVYGYHEAVKPQEPIVWHVASFNKNVTKVLIRFDDAKGGYFSSRTDTGSSLVKDLKVVAYDRDAGSTMGEALVWADAPPYDTRVVDKYWVIGLDDGGNEVEEASLDPKIIVDGP